MHATVEWGSPADYVAPLAFVTSLEIVSDAGLPAEPTSGSMLDGGSSGRLRGSVRGGACGSQAGCSRRAPGERGQEQRGRQAVGVELLYSSMRDL